MIPIFRMGGQTLGILGCGRIGSLVYQKLKSFGFQFLICDPYLTEERKRELGIETVDQETMFRGSDFVTIHTPLSSETRHIVNRETLAMMKPTRLPGEHRARADGGCATRWPRRCNAA